MQLIKSPCTLEQELDSIHSPTFSICHSGSPRALGLKTLDTCLELFTTWLHFTFLSPSIHISLLSVAIHSCELFFLCLCS